MIIPETEGRSLEEIEMHFSDNKLGLTDRKIKQCLTMPSHVTNVNNPVTDHATHGSRE